MRVFDEDGAGPFEVVTDGHSMALGDPCAECETRTIETGTLESVTMYTAMGDEVDVLKCDQCGWMGIYL